MSTAADAPASPSPAVPAPEISAVVGACPSCGAPMAGRYCGQCGERRLHGEPSLRRFLREAGQEVVDVDSRTVRTARALLLHPGTLTQEHLAGRRRPYVGPFKLYLFVFAVTMFASSLVQMTPSGGRAQAGALVAWLNSITARIGARQHLTLVQAEARLMAATLDHMRWFALLVPLVFGCAVHLLFRRRRRWFAENMVFATHYAAFYYFAAFVLLPVNLALARSSAWVMAAVGVVITAVMGGYLYAAVRRVYGVTRPVGALASLALLAGFSVAEAVTTLLAFCSAVATLLYF